jgi:LmbE family N-acetylglucosaminyl deacetylase
MRKIAFLTSLNFSLFLSILCAQEPQVLNSAEIFLRIKKLNTLGSVLYIAAHPDDENSRLIPYLAKERLFRTGYLSMTRGDGGQNLIGDEQGVELGLIRTQEMLAARRIDGGEQFFTRAFDFGFTKTTEEALKTWGKEKTLSDVVWIIRRFQPDVIITRFPEDSRAGHGHHSASSLLAHEAFEAAGDPKRFPEQFKFGVKPWRPTRLLWNTFNFGNVNTTSEDQFKIDVGLFNPILAKSYGEIAADSRSQHKTQGGALTRTRGEAFEYFSLVDGSPPGEDLMSGVVTSWNRVENGGPISSLVNQLIADYSLTSPEKSIPGLVNLYQHLQLLKDGYWKTQKSKEVQQLIEACDGLWLEATVRGGYAVQGGNLSISFTVNNRNGTRAKLRGVELISSATARTSRYHDINPSEPLRRPQLDSVLQIELDKNKNVSFNYAFRVDDAEPITQPYWLEEEMSPGSYNVKDQFLIGDAQSPPAFEARFRLNIGGQDFTFSRGVQYKYTDPVQGELYEPLTILPKFTGQMDPQLIVFDGQEEKSFEARIRDQTNRNILPKLSLSNTDPLQVKEVGSGHNSIVNYTAKPVSTQSRTFFSKLQIQPDGKLEDAKELITISYNHIPRIDYFRDAGAQFVIANVQISGKRIGYIEGAGDKLPEVLMQMGYDVVMLKERDITPSNCKPFDAIITGVRAYNVHPWLSEKYDVLMDYIKAGGNLVVQYNTGGQSGPLRANISPFPLSISRNRVTDENAKVRFLLPNHPVLNFPNKITDQDFEGWVQERGIYFADPIDPHFESVLAMNDPNDSEQKGSLIIANYGQGKFVYTGLVFFRELPAGVPGAYRLMANIIALNQKKGF